MRKNFKAFTLVEMLIVMGIIIILMAVGITAGRYAINRANDVAHQNAVDNIYTALQAYYADNRQFPMECTDGTTTGDCTPQALVGTAATPGELTEYMDSGTFDGGTSATYLYLVESSQGQSTLVCVTLGGIGDEKEQGIYCNGNGFNDAELASGAITEKNVEVATSAYTAIGGVAGTSGSNWTDESTWATASNFGGTGTSPE